MDDSDWARTVKLIGQSLRQDGLFVAGGHFGLLDGLNAQIDEHGKINKRLRSYRNWKRCLKKSDFSRVYFYKNSANAKIDDYQPENNVLIASKPNSLTPNWVKVVHPCRASWRYSWITATLNSAYIITTRMA